MNGGLRQPHSCLARLVPEARQDPEAQKRSGWRDHGILVVSVADHRLAWPERELVKQLGEKLYGARNGKEAGHG